MAQQAGWYDDPQDDSILRYWDGVQWTNHTSPRFKPDLDQAGRAREADTQPGQPAGGYAQAPGPGQGGAGSEPADPYAAGGGQGYGQAGQGYPYGQQQGQQPYPYGQQQGWGQQPMPGGGYGAAYAGPTTPDGQPLAGWGMRLLARILDGIVLGILGSIVLLVVAPDLTNNLTAWFEQIVADIEAGSSAMTEMPAALQQDILRGGTVSAVVFLIYEVLMLRFVGATLGKLATGLRVRLRDQPGPLPWGAAAIRGLIWQGPNLVGGTGALGTLASLFTIVNGLWPLWDRNRQALHDKAAKTNVVKKSR